MCHAATTSSPLTGVSHGRAWCVLIVIFCPFSISSVKCRFRRQAFSSKSQCLCFTVICSLGWSWFFLFVCSFTVSVFYSSVIAAVYLLLRWIFYFNHYILGNLVLSGVSPVCSGQYLFSSLRISATVSSGIRCLNMYHLLQKPPGCRRMVSSYVDFFSNLFLKAKLK